MFGKRNLKQYVYLLQGTFRRMKYIIGVPVILYGMILTFWNWYDIRNPDPLFSKFFIDDRMLLLLPIGIVISMIYAIHPYIIEQGRELLYMHKKQMVLEICLHILWNVLVISVVFLSTYVQIMPLPELVYVKYIAVILLYTGLSFGFLFAFHSITMSILVLVLIYLVQLTGRYGLSMLPHYMNWTYDKFSYIPEILILFGVAFGGLWIGYLFWKRYDAYDDGYYLWLNVKGRNGTDKAQENRHTELPIVTRIHSGIVYIRSNLSLLTPVILFLVISVPALIYIQLSRGSVSEAEYVVQNAMELIYPIGLLSLLVIWLYPYVGEQGREVLYVINRNKLPECMTICFFVVVIMLTTVTLGYRENISNLGLFCTKNILLLLFYFGIAYGSLYAFSSVTAMLLCFFISMITYQMRLLGFGYISHYDLMIEGVETLPQLFCYMKQYIIIAVIGTVIGYVKNRRYWNYS